MKTPRLAMTYRAARRNGWKRCFVARASSPLTWLAFCARVVLAGWPRKNKRRKLFVNRKTERTAPHAQRRMVARRAMA